MDEDDDHRALWSSLETAITAAEALPYIEVPIDDLRIGGERNEGRPVALSEVTLAELRPALGYTQTNFKNLSITSGSYVR
jgi:hypothetical protein